MNKKGFTLAELLGVIVILGILITIATAVYTTVFDNQKEHTYQNKVTTIEVAAEKWADETNLSKPITITVKRLVAESFYQADYYNEDTELMEVLDPRDDSSMLCNTIDITTSDGIIEAHFTGNKDCDLSKQEEEKAKIKIAAYEYDTVSKKVIKVLKNRDDLISILPWTRYAVLLVVEPTEEGYKDYTKVIYTNGAYSETKEVVNNNRISTTNILNKVVEPNNYANAYLVDAELILNTEYNIAIDLPKTSDDDKIYGLKSNDITVRIDKEIPSLTTAVEGEYTTNPKKKVTIKGSDGSGSGLKTFYVTTSPNGHDQGELMNKPTDPLINNTLEIELGLGTYYVYAEDNVGNMNDNKDGKGPGPEKVEIINIDDSRPSCVISVTSGTLGANGWYTSDVELTFTTSVAGSTGYNYYFGTSSTPVYSGGIASGYVKEKENTTRKYTVTQNGTQQYYGYIKTPLGVTAKCDTTGLNGGKGLKIDKTPPSISAIDDPLILDDRDYTFTDNINKSCGVSGLDRLVCVPPESKKEGSYTVECTVTCNNGLTASVSFKVMHSYDAIQGNRDSKTSMVEKCGGNERCEWNGDETKCTTENVMVNYKGQTVQVEEGKHCIHSCTGDYGNRNVDQWVHYKCDSNDKVNCPAGWNHCSGNYHGDPNNPTAYICILDGGCTGVNTTTYSCPTKNFTLDGQTYNNIKGKMVGSYCYYCPKGGTFNSTDKKCHY